jgi:hypothetical protein
MPPQPISAICIVSLADRPTDDLACSASRGAPIPASAAERKNFRLFTTNYFVPDQDLESLLEEVVAGAGEDLEEPESDLAPSDFEFSDFELSDLALSDFEPSE